MPFSAYGSHESHCGVSAPHDVPAPPSCVSIRAGLRLQGMSCKCHDGADTSRLVCASTLPSCLNGAEAESYKPTVPVRETI